MTTLSVRVRWWRFRDRLRINFSRKAVQTISLDPDGKTLLVFGDHRTQEQLTHMQIGLLQFMKDDGQHVAVLDGLPGVIRVIRVQH
jgi:hypothetical protein